MNNRSQRRVVDGQVDDMLARSRSFRSLPAAEQAEIRKNTAAIVETMAGNQMAQAKTSGARADPYAVPLNTGNEPPQFTGGAQPGSADEAFGPKKQGDFGTAIATGVSQAGALLRQVNFPAFVAELIQGVFQAVVDASIQQMKAYGELVQSVAMSLNDFRDANVSENQARDHLVGKFPNIMQINVTDTGPRVGLRPDLDIDEMPDVGEALNMGESLTDFDDDTIEEQLVPAARNDLARSRQSLLATMLLMGLNRIIVTDGKINAKLKFNFAAQDTYTQRAQDYDYEEYGVARTSVGTVDKGLETGESYKENRHRSRYYNGGSRSGESSRWLNSSTTETETPVIQLTSFEDNMSEGQLSASAQMAGNVSLNFRSETFDINQLASADEVFKLQRVGNGAGRAAPAAAAETGAATEEQTAGG